MYYGYTFIYLVIINARHIYSYIPKRATLRPPKPDRKTPKGPILHRRERAKESNQLRNEMIMKYWRRIGKEVNEVPFDNLPNYSLDISSSFIANEVLPQMAEISYNQEANTIKLDAKKSENFTRLSCLQFLQEINNLFTVCHEGFCKHKRLNKLVEMGPSNEMGFLSYDIRYMTKLTKSTEEFRTEHSKYINYLEDLGESNPIALISHAYYFYKEWHLSKFHILSAMKHHLKITWNFKSAAFNEDVVNFESVLNLLALGWTPEEKSAFLDNLIDASERSKCYTKCFAN